MYVLESIKKKGKNKSYISFENFDSLLNVKNELEKNGMLCSIYKIKNDGKSLTRLTNKEKYEKVSNVENERKKNWKQYVYVREWLDKKNVKNYVKNNILYVKNNSDIFEVEMVRKTPRYVVKKNGEVVDSSITSQNDLIDMFFGKKRKRKSIIL